MNNKLKHYLFIITLFVLLGMFSISLLTEIVCAQNSGTTLSAGTTVSKNDAHKTVGWASSFTGQTVTRTLTVSASDGKMKDVTYSADPGSEWSGSYSGSSASFTGNQKITATASDPNSPYKPSFQGTVVLTGGSGSSTQEHTYSWDVEGSYEIKEVKIKKIYVNGQDYTDGQITVLIGTTHQFAATPDPDGAPWPVEKPVWNTSPNLTVPNIDVTFHNEGTHTLTATCVNSKSVTVKVVKPEPYSIGFSGNGQITLKKNNPNNDIYQNNGDTAITNPVWIKGIKNDPIAYKINAQPMISAVFKVSENLTFAGTCTVKASVPYSDGSTSDGTAQVNFSAGTSSASTSLSNFLNFQNYIATLSLFDINWFVANNQNGWVGLGMSEHPYYVTYDNTIGTTTVKRIHWATLKANGATTITQASAMVAQALAQSPGYTRDAAGNLPNDLNAWRFLDSGMSGDCATLSKLAVTCLAVLGVPAECPKHSFATNHACPIPQGNPDHLKHVCSETCKNLCTRTFNYTHSCNNVLAIPQKLIYTGNNYEAFFSVNDPGIKAFTVYPYGGPYSNPNYYYLEVLKSVSGSAEQFWINNTPIIPHPTDPDLPGTPTIFCCPYCQSNYPDKPYLYQLPFRLDNSTVPYPAIPDNNDTCVE